MIRKLRNFDIQFNFEIFNFGLLAFLEDYIVKVNCEKHDVTSEDNSIIVLLNILGCRRTLLEYEMTLFGFL